ncbi:MAG: FG-GAP-like repeat-containing protein [Chloroherpetonaceae bacterium]
MRKISFLFVFLFCVCSLKSQDTLRYWNPTDDVAYFNPTITKSTWQFQRFEIAKPIFINSFSVYLFGENSEVTIKLLGNQGGSSLPTLFIYSNQDVLATADFTFPGSQTPLRLDFALPNPIYFAGHQVYLAINIKNNQKCFFATNQIQYNPTCQPGGDLAPFYYQYFVNTDLENYTWSYAYYSFFSDLIYTKIPDNPDGKYLRDYTGTFGLSFNIPGNTVAWGDLNNDGFQDVLVSGRLYVSTDGTQFQEQTTKLGLQGIPSANAFVDVDNDGDLDILFLFSNETASLSNVLYINDGMGNMTKKDLAMTKFTNVSGFSFTDTNYDGFPDLFVSQSVTSSNPPTVLPNYFYQNNGQYLFLTKSNVCQTSPARASTACQFIDYNNDGFQDLYVSNGYFQPDELWENRGIFTYTNVIDSKKIDLNQVGTQKLSDWGVGCDWYDYDNNGYPDLFLPNFCNAAWIKDGHRSSTIYKNINSSFTDTYNAVTGLPGIGIDFEETYAGGAWGDIDNDGLADLFVPASETCRYSKLYHQKPGNTFENISYDWGVSRITSQNDALWVDVDNDGMLDLALSDNNNFKIYRNFYKNSNSWIELDLVGKECNKFAIGARVKVYTDEGKMYSQEVTVGHGRNMQKPYRLHFGLGNSKKIDRVEVLWYHATSWEVFNNIELNKITKLTQIGTSVASDLQSGEFLEIYPDPVEANNFSIEFALNKSGVAQVLLYDMKGMIIQEFTNQYYASGANYLNCEIGNIANGAYFIGLITPDKRIVKPIIIAR